MAVHNREIVALLTEMANYLEISGDNPFRIRAYREAARTLDDLSQSLAQMVADGEDLSAIPGVGKNIAEKIHEIVETGHLPQLEKLKKKIPIQLDELLTLPGLGPKRIKVLYEKLNIKNRDDLAAAARTGAIHALDGFGEKTEQSILAELEKQRDVDHRFQRTEVEEIVDELVDYLAEVEGVNRVTIAGSYRRCRETIGDLDILVTCSEDSPVMDYFVEYEDVEKVISHGTTRSSVWLRTELQVDLRVVEESSYGAALQYFTGSKAHNIALRKIAVAKKLKINEYGVFRGEKPLKTPNEEDVYRQVGLPYIEPELREGRGEIEAAKTGNLPMLITVDDIRGDLHSHTTTSDGYETLAEMALAAKRRGYNYLAITEHSKRLTIANGLDEKRLRRQINAIDKLNEQFRGFRVLKGIECDILADGSLDLDDSVLAELDLVVGSLHSKFNLSSEKQTERILRAMDNPHFNILGHPTGRMIGHRPPYELDMERVMKGAVERGCFLELNSQPDRLDLNDVHCRQAKELGLKVVISTDSHSACSMDYIRYGVAQARRGWLEPDDVVNTRTWRDLKKLLKRG
jgi:DNA polymerase (family 10)